MNSDSKARYVGLFGLGVFAVWLTAGIGSGFYRCLASVHWPTVAAYVSSSEVNTGTSNIGTWWAPAISYEYEVGGKRFEAANIRYLMPHYYRETPAADTIAPYPAGSQVRVSYDPQNPAESVLEPGVPSGMWKQALIPLFFWAVVGVIWFEIDHPNRRRLLRSNAEMEAEPEDEARAA
jgi:hypothetical protein